MILTNKVKNKVKNIVKEFILSDNGIICLEICLQRNLFNDYLHGYIAFRLIDLLGRDICTNVNIFKKSNKFLDLI